MSKSTCVRLSNSSYKILAELKKTSGFPITKIIEILYAGLDKKYKKDVLKAK